jgi:hypothetical protein
MRIIPLLLLVLCLPAHATPLEVTQTPVDLAVTQGQAVPVVLTLTNTAELLAPIVLTGEVDYTDAAGVVQTFPAVSTTLRVNQDIAVGTYRLTLSGLCELVPGSATVSDNAGLTLAETVGQATFTLKRTLGPGESVSLKFSVRMP